MESSATLQALHSFQNELCWENNDQAGYKKV